MSANLVFLLMALAAGISIPTQAGINAQLNLFTRSPVLAATVSFAVGTLTLVVYALLARTPLPSPASLSGHPWWIWTGGILGAFFVASTVVLAPRLGASTMVVLVLAGQMIASLLLDHYGWLGYPVHPVSVGRIAGVALVCIGVVLVRWF
ncbi:DMT family transporter [Geothermobacter hydrogeniphilus]|uniref:Transporter family-2 protein n=1 Tax=Geothermobacter hydrogeniphilus TaxID=1969733 RepID=A0A1X0YCZ5_9BACT|nr:DMT family transporter [Geothermobacter hydrogeniphilus]ORJ62953.1 hypothetical protein B5V00_02570 [Geothermobacter hydrogeniphilus]